VFDASLGSPTATSYISVENCLAILDGLPQSAGVAAWLALPLPDQERSLNAATMVLDPLAWKGVLCECEQRLAWPRQISGCDCQPATCQLIPFDIELATAFLATEVGATGGGYVGSGSSTGGGATGGLDDYSEVKIGPITVKMKPDSSTNNSSSNFGQLPAFVADLIKSYINGANGIGQACVTRAGASRVRAGALTAAAWSGTMQFAWTGDGQRVVMPRAQYGGWASFQSGTSSGNRSL